MLFFFPPHASHPARFGVIFSHLHALLSCRVPSAAYLGEPCPGVVAPFTDSWNCSPFCPKQNFLCVFFFFFHSVALSLGDSNILGNSYLTGLHICAEKLGDSVLVSELFTFIWKRSNDLYCFKIEMLNLCSAILNARRWQRDNKYQRCPRLWQAATVTVGKEMTTERRSGCKYDSLLLEKWDCQVCIADTVNYTKWFFFLPWN